MSRQYCTTCQVNMVTRVKSLSESQFDPYICYFDSIPVPNFLKKFQFHPPQIETKFNFYNDIFIKIDLFIKYFNNI